MVPKFDYESDSAFPFRLNLPRTCTHRLPWPDDRTARVASEIFDDAGEGSVVEAGLKYEVRPQRLAIERRSLSQYGHARVISLDDTRELGEGDVIGADGGESVERQLMMRRAETRGSGGVSVAFGCRVGV